MVLLPDGRAKIRAEGEAETHSAWMRWYSRWKECQGRGEPFNEPPPDPPDGYRNGKSDDGGSE